MTDVFVVNASRYEAWEAPGKQAGSRLKRLKFYCAGDNLRAFPGPTMVTLTDAQIGKSISSWRRSAYSTGSDTAELAIASISIAASGPIDNHGPGRRRAQPAFSIFFVISAAWAGVKVLSVVSLCLI